MYPASRAVSIVYFIRILIPYTGQVGLPIYCIVASFQKDTRHIGISNIKYFISFIGKFKSAFVVMKDE